MATDITKVLQQQQWGDFTNPNNGNSFEGKTGKFNISSYSYPSDLGSLDLRHYVTFEINVRGKSKFNTGNRQFIVQGNPDAAGLTNKELSTAATNLGAVAGIAAGSAIGIGISEKFAVKVGKTGAAKAAAKVTGAVVGGAAGGGVVAAAINFNSLLQSDTKYRISDVIALHLDGPPTVKYGMNYANKDLGLLAGLAGGGVIDTLFSLDAISEAGAAAVTAFAKLPSAFGMGDLQSTLSASSKTSLNPFREVIFESVDFRSFAFKYKFLPKSREESDAVRNIIRLFKFHMHPEMSENKLFFIYPSEFQITYHFANGPNTYFHKMAPTVLESMEVTYGGEQFSAFKDGHPTEVNVTLTFREVEILTKKMIGDVKDAGGGY